MSNPPLIFIDVETTGTRATVDTYRILNRFLGEPERHNLTVQPL